MSKHHTSKQGRTHGAYQRRLQARGLSSAPPMPDLESLRRKQARRVQGLIGDEIAVDDEAVA